MFTCLEIFVSVHDNKCFFDKEKINTFRFTNGRYLFLNDLHGNYIICTVECTFHLTIDIQSLKTFYVLFAERCSSFCKFYFSLCIKYLKNKIRY